MMGATGYDKLAAFLAADPSSSFFRRFAKLNAKNLLYLQAELVNLEAELDDIVEQDGESEENEKALFPISVWHLKNSDGKRGETQWVKCMEIRGLLKEYNDALLQQAQILHLSNANKPDLEVLRDWLFQQTGSSSLFYARENGPWEEDCEDDLIALAGRHERADKLTLWMYERVVPWFHRLWGHRSQFRKNADIEMGIWKYDDKKIVCVTNALTILISALLPASSMIALYLVKNPLAKLVTVFIYNLVLSTLLGVMVKARRIEIFAALTAFAAVQAAFITNSPGLMQN